MAKARLAPLVVASILGALGCFSAERTSVRVHVDWPGIILDQIEITILEGDAGIAAALVPEAPAGALAGPLEHVLEVDPALDGAWVTVYVIGREGGVGLATGAAGAPVLAGREITVAVTLATCEADAGDFCRADGFTRVGCDAAGWTLEEYCPFGCAGGRCNACLPDSVFCDDGAVVACAGGAIDVIEACAFDCIEGACVDCYPGTVLCQGDTLVECSSGGEILSSIDCVFGCKGDAILRRCNYCIPSTNQCIGDDLVECDEAGIINSSTPCTYGCDPDAVICRSCNPSTIECQSSQLVTCDAAGNVIAVDDCSAYGCQTGTDPDSCNQCLPAPPAMSLQCQGASIIACSSLGLLLSSTPCPSGCNATMGTCNACTPDTTACMGSWLVVCDPFGNIAIAFDCGPGTCDPVTASCV